ncbi:MAG: CopG family transcriptional regulator [Candidatus Latescibacteria bacterium]|nr:CopG family transcriptional regulator [Candidatus Latescibacterota bacterium]
MKQTKPVEIPQTLYKAIEKRIRDGDFLSVSDFVTYAVRRVLSELSQHQEPPSEKEKEGIKEKLKALGYL